MIEIDYAIEVGQNLSIGNRMFQYAFARILAEEKGWALKARPISNFPATDAMVAGLAFSEPLKILSGHQVDFEGLRRCGAARIFLSNACYVQRYEYYRAHKEKVRKWFEPIAQVEISNHRDLVIHLRLGDYLAMGKAISYDFLNTVIASISFERLYVVTDDKANLDLSRLAARDRLADVISSPSWLADMQFIASFDKILLTGSTFAWWPAWLSTAAEVHCAVTQNGFWTLERTDLDLFVDEPRYLFHVPGRSQPQGYRELSELRKSVRRSGGGWLAGLRGAVARLAGQGK